MAIGWAKDGAVQDQIDANIKDAIADIRQHIPQGESLYFCKECGNPIPEARRLALPGVRFCINCQAENDRQQARGSHYNRRGSKDSQLR